MNTNRDGNGSMENLFRTVGLRKVTIDSLPLPVFYKDKDGKYLGCNVAFELFIGRKECDIVGKSVYDLGPKEIADEYFKKDRELIRDGGKQVYEWVVKTTSGETRNVQFHKSLFNDDLGNVAGIVGSVLDITNQKQAVLAQEKLQQQLLLASKLASVGSLAAGVAHEINNPLTIIKGSVALLKMKASMSRLDTEQLLKTLANQEAAVDRMTNIVNGLLTFARVDTDTLDSVDVQKVITDTLDLYGSLFLQSALGVETRFHAGDMLVKANFGKLQQVLMNLLTNARDAMESVATKGLVRVQTLEQDGQIVIRCCDSGVGIEQDNLAKIFDPFFTTKEPGKGTGLGLSISHSIISSFGGKILVSSEVGVGACFEIYLPKAIS